MTKEVKKLMKMNNLYILRQGNKCIWKHIGGAIIVTSLTPSDHRAIKNIRRDIKKVIGHCK